MTEWGWAEVDHQRHPFDGSQIASGGRSARVGRRSVFIPFHTASEEGYISPGGGKGNGTYKDRQHKYLPPNVLIGGLPGACMAKPNDGCSEDKHARRRHQSPASGPGPAQIDT